MKKNCCKSCLSAKGFTLIELLVVVLIIGILAAIALPQYQKAVLKSKFSSLMPTTKAIRDSQEAYYLTHSRYANAVNKLDITAANTNDMTITLSDDIDYAYTMATRPNIDNNLIMYQKHSLNFPGEIHCEALETSEKANWLCEKALHGEKISGSITSEYNTYILEGPNNGLFEGMSLGASCDKAFSMGYTCNLTTDEDGNVTQKKVCNSDGICSIINYNENGYTRTTCQLNANNVCETKQIYTYDENGNMTSQRKCQTAAADGSCSTYASVSYSNYDYTYDENGNLISKRHCQTVAADGSCSAYYSWGHNAYMYDANGRLISDRACKTVAADGSCATYSTGNTSDTNYDYTYDANGNKLSQRKCQAIAEDGSCSTYASYNNYDYTYDANGNMTSQRHCQSVAADGSCSGYASYNNYDYTYDENGNKTSWRTCKTIVADGSCSAYESYNNYDYTYDANGNMTSQFLCLSVAADGSCSAYNLQMGTGNHVYTYDENGNKLTQRSCQTIAADGSCSTYHDYGYDYAYDANGNMTSYRSCQSVAADGSCSAYNIQTGSSNTDYAYDEEGNKLAEKWCQTWNNTRTECLVWKVQYYY